jgi:RNA polymerase sigma factor (sigma-70 family)
MQKQSCTNFDKLAEEIQQIASYFSYRYHYRFEKDELINELWLKDHELDLPSKHKIIKRIKWNMMDYIRKENGRDIFIDGKKVPRPKLITNIETFFPIEGEEEEENSVLDTLVVDKSLESFEDHQLLCRLFQECLAEQEREIISLYYFYYLTMKQVGDKIGVHESTISSIIKKAIQKCQEKLTEECLV